MMATVVTKESLHENDNDDYDQHDWTDKQDNGDECDYDGNNGYYGD